MMQLQKLREWMEKGASIQLLTLMEAPKGQQACTGQMILLEPDGMPDGVLINEQFTSFVLEQIKGRQWTKPVAIALEYQGGSYRLFWNWVGADRYQAVILGGGHISQPLAQLLSMMDYEVRIVDDRLEFANQERFPWAKEVFCSGFEQALRQIEIDEKTAIFIVTRGHRHDLECLQAVLPSRAGYIGMIGSRRKVRAALSALEEEGFDRERLGQVYAPIGLDIGAQSPAEIAVSIAAEVMAVFRKAGCLPLRDKERKEHG